MSQAVGDRAAIEFAVGFYDALWAGESIEFAHELGCTLIQIQGISEQLTPKLLKKQLDSELITPPSESGLNLLANEVIESRSTTKNQNDLDDDLSSDRVCDYIRSETVQPRQTDDLSSDRNFIPVLWENGKQKPEPTEEKEASTLSPRLGYQPNIQTNFEEIIETQSPLQDELDDDLSSECGQDYTRLRNLLKEKQWKEADQETHWMMIQAVGKKEGDWFGQDELLNFPCKDLRTIDRLWVKYSDGRFGFSVQKQIYLRVGGKPDGEYYQEAWLKFGDSVGWRAKGTVILYNEGIFDTSSPLGHLPVGWVLCRVCGWYGSAVSSLALRLVDCNL